MLQDDPHVGLPADLGALTSVAPAVELPDGEVLTSQSDNVTSLCWISDGPPDARLFTQLRADHRRTGLLPLLLCDDSEVYGDRCTVGVTPLEPMDHIDRWDTHSVMTRIWDGLCQADSELGPAYELDVLAPFDYTCPGPARPGSLLVEPDILTTRLLERFIDEETRLGLVPITRGADVLTALGWSGAANHVSRTAGLCAMLRGWEERFGARVVRLGPDRLDLTVAAPPHEVKHAATVAAEHWTFCPDPVLHESGSISAYADTIKGSRTWSFWWE